MYVVGGGEKVSERVRFCLFPLLPLLTHSVFLELICAHLPKVGAAWSPARLGAMKAQAPGSEGGGGWDPGLQGLRVKG